MTTINVVTSCSAKGWNEYGRRFVETFLQHWPAEIALHLVSEDDLDLSEFAAPMSIGHLRFYNLWQASPQAEAFELRHRDNPRSQGRDKMPERVRTLKRDRDYNFRLDAYRFAKKVFAIQAACGVVQQGRLFWVDADVETFAAVPAELLLGLLPDGHALSCLDRGMSYHSECGFVGYNLDHPMARALIDAFADLYATDTVFELSEWHDSWVFDWLRRKMNVPTFAIPHNSRHHPAANSVLGDVLDHKKGRRKELGKTPTHEVLSSKRRALPYWRDRQ